MSHEDLSDEELVELIMESLQEDGRIRTDCVNIESMRGKPILSGRVASDEELEIINEVLIDVLNLDDFENNIWVDDTLAFEAPEEGENSERTTKPPLEEEEEVENDASFEEVEKDEES